MMDAHLLYRNDVDFATLALQSPPFNKYLKFNGQLDFSDPNAVLQLTKSLLKRDFGLEIDLPADRLCPPVPNRLNYILWIQDLLDTSSNTYTDQYDPDRHVVGLDIGTGASSIYPLLGCSLRPNWRFLATDIDEKSMEYAIKNILQNNLKSRIYPRLTLRDDNLLALDVFGLEKIDFTICNPPFYSSRSDLLTAAAAKSRPPHSACTGADVEMVTPGGEVAFVRRMINESLSLKTRCQWFTSMLGKLHSVPLLVETLRSVGVENWCVKEFIQGEKTRRWAIAWSWLSLKPAQSIARGIPGLPKHLLPFPVEFTFTLSFSSMSAASNHLKAIFASLDIEWQYRPSIATGIGFAKGNVWSRAARRQQYHHQQEKRNADTERRHESMQEDEDEDEDEDEEDEEDEGPKLGFKIQLSQKITMTTLPSLNRDETGNKAGSVVILVRWIKGTDKVLFESLCGMVRSRLIAA